jgi:ERF superfamily
MHRSSESIAALAAALAKAQTALTNPEKSLTGTLPGSRPDEPGRTFRYAPLSSGLDIVRKVLGQHEIATLQTTVIDHDIQTVSLTTVLAHASGEWIASDWPVCALSEMATPRRMGAALTYARRYALFTLVGIAGEDDLDAPDLAGQPAEGAPKAGNGFDQGKVNGSGAAVTVGTAGTLGAFSKNRKPWVPPKQALAPEASATLRDRLVGELSGLASADEAITWAQRALSAKNTLRDVDAAVVEAAFASRMTELGEGGEASLPSSPEAGEGPAESTEPTGRAELMAALRASVEIGGAKEAPLPAERHRRKRRRPEQAPPSAPPQPSALPHASAPAQPEVPPVNNAVLWHVDKSALPLSEPRRYRDRAHLESVASQPCLLCGRQPSDAHHLRFMQPRAMGRRVSDEFAVPLCRTHHRAVHRHGDEVAWWKSAGIDPAVIAHRLWQHTRLNGAPIQEHLDPLLGPPTVQAAKDAGPEQSAGPARR